MMPPAYDQSRERHGQQCRIYSSGFRTAAGYCTALSHDRVRSSEQDRRCRASSNAPKITVPRRAPNNPAQQFPEGSHLSITSIGKMKTINWIAETGTPTLSNITNAQQQTNGENQCDAILNSMRKA